MKWFGVLAIAVVPLLMSHRVVAQACQCRSVEGSVETVLAATSQAGRELQLRFEANSVTRSTRLAFLCVDPPAPVALARLWMPEHGHGSSPPQLVSVDPTCTRVERVSFVMRGLWEVQVKLADNDSATFSLQVSN
jgi:hypothetical protein